MALSGFLCGTFPSELQSAIFLISIPSHLPPNNWVLAGTPGRNMKCFTMRWGASDITWGFRKGNSGNIKEDLIIRSLLDPLPSKPFCLLLNSPAFNVWSCGAWPLFLFRIWVDKANRWMPQSYKCTMLFKLQHRNFQCFTLSLNAQRCLGASDPRDGMRVLSVSGGLEPPAPCRSQSGNISRNLSGFRYPGHQHEATEEKKLGSKFWVLPNSWRICLGHGIAFTPMGPR